MRALGLPASPLLTEANTLGFFVNDKLVNGLFPATNYSLFVEVILTIFGEKMLTGNFSDS